MLAILGAATILTLVAVLLANRISAVAALILVPIVYGLIGGFGLSLSPMIVGGVKTVAPTATTFVFAILYFGVVADAGMLQPIIDRVLKLVGNSPIKIAVGTAVLAVVVHLDGTAAVAIIITLTAMTPLFDKLKMDRRVLATLVGLAVGINILPWIAPVLRASATMKVTPMEIFYPLILPAATGLIYLFVLAWWLGRREQRRLASANPNRRGVIVTELKEGLPSEDDKKRAAEREAILRPHLFWVNIVLTLIVLGVLVAGLVQPMVMFMLGTAVALVINYPNPTMQVERISAHSRAALMMASILLASGVFAGILHDSGMLMALAQAAAHAVPAGLGHNMPLALALVSAPLSIMFDPDSYYFGVLPVLSQLYGSMGGEPIEMARASLMGLHTVGALLSPNTPVTFLLIGMTGLTLGQHQKHMFLWAILGSFAMTATAVLCGAILL